MIARASAATGQKLSFQIQLQAKRSFHQLGRQNHCQSLGNSLLTATSSGFGGGFSRRSYSNFKDLNDEEERPRTALVLGSSGATGSAVARYLSRDLGMKVVGADVMELPNDFTMDWELDGFISLPEKADLSDLMARLVRGVDFSLQGEAGLDAIVCASGGFETDPVLSVESNEGPTDTEMEAGAMQYAESLQRMMRMNLDPVVAAGYVAQHYMAPEGLMVVIGATAALGPTPGMMGYGLSKTAAHQLVQTMGSTTGKSIGTKSERKAGRRVRRHVEALDSMTVLSILPTTIDTPSNRKAMPEGDFEKWTKPFDIAKEIGVWIEKPPLRGHSGSLIKVFPQRDGPGAAFELVR
jgi:dihydropteridine reductase